MPDDSTTAAMRIAFVAGVTPDKWLRIWAERSPLPITAELVADDEQVAVLHDHAADVCFVRLPVDRAGLHVIPLYVELAVVVLAKGHAITALDTVTMGDLVDEPAVDLAAMTTRQAIEVVASGSGYVIVPMSVARLYHRKDVETRPMADVDGSQIGLAWLADNDDERIEQFIGIVRGRTERSTRGEATPPTRTKTGKPNPDAGRPKRPTRHAGARHAKRRPR